MTQQIPNWLKKRAFLSPSRTAIYFENQSYTFQEVYAKTQKIAERLCSLSIKRGDYIGVLLKNHPDTVIYLYALQMIGASAVILNIRLTEDELAWQLLDSKCKVLITEDALLPKIINVKANQASCSIITKEQLAQTVKTAKTSNKAKTAPATSTAILEEFDLDDICTIMYTSGTTGFPKGVKQSYGNHWWSAIGSVLNLGLADGDCWLCTVPLFHISGYSILIKSLVYGIPVVLHDGFQEQKVIDDIEKYNVTIMSVVSTILTRLVRELGNRTISSYFRCMLLGGGPASLALLEECKLKGIPVFQTYGMTETSSQIVTLSPEDCLNKLGSAGKPLFPAQLKIVDNDGQELKAKQEGEIVVKGPNVTSGYLFREQETAERIRNGWLHTGDIGYVDEEGFLYVLDRRADLIISGGENIYPAEIEGVLLAHSQISDAGVIGVDDEKWGQVPIAFVVTDGGNLITEADISHYCQQKLAKYKIPKKIFFTNQLPRNAANKLLRRDLRDLLERESGQ